MKKILKTLVFCLLLISCNERPKTLGVVDGKLAPCVDKSNCVSSQDMREKYYVKPLAFKGDLKDSYNRIIKVLKGMSGAKIVSPHSTYIHAEFTSSIFKFVDDVEFFFDERRREIDIKSASRTGHSDLGVNKKRVDDIKFRFIQN